MKGDKKDEPKLKTVHITAERHGLLKQEALDIDSALDLRALVDLKLSKPLTEAEKKSLIKK